MQKVFGIQEELYLFGIMKTSPDDNGQVGALAFDYYKQFKNALPKDKIIKHIEILDFLCLAAHS